MTESTRTVERALALLAAVADAGTTTLADAARAVDLSPSTALRLLRTLEGTGFLRREDDGYRVGARLIQLGAKALSHESLIELSRDAMANVSAQTRESTYLSVRGHDDTALYVAIVEGSHSVRHANWVGRTVPLRGTAAGAALTCVGDPSEVTVIDRGIEHDVTAFAAPVTAAGRVVAALSILAPTYRVTSESTSTLRAALVAAASEISRQLSGASATP